MKRITAVFLAATALLALSGCGLAMDETIDEDGNVRKMTAEEQSALVGADPVVNPDQDGATGTSTTGPQLPVLPGTESEPTTSPHVDPTIAQVDDGIALPQDPIPLVEPGKAGPQPQGGPRVGPSSSF